MKLSIVISTFNRHENLSDCLESLNSQVFKDFEVLIIEAGDFSKTKKIVDKFSKLKISLVERKKAGLVECRNIGLAKAKGQYIAFIDDDVVLDKNWAKSAVEILNDNKNMGGVTGPTIIPEKILKTRDVFWFYGKDGMIAKIYKSFLMESDFLAVGRIFKSGMWSIGTNFKSCLKIKNREVDYLEACNMVWRKSVLKKVGGFDEKFGFMGSFSEPDLAFRVRELGYKLLYSSKVRLNHMVSVGGLVNQRGKESKIKMESFMLYYFRHVFKWKYPFRFLGSLLLFDMYWIYKLFQSRDLSWFGGIVGTFTGLKYALRYNRGYGLKN